MLVCRDLCHRDYEKLVADNDCLRAENTKLRSAIAWALGEAPDAEGKWFSDTPTLTAKTLGRYWWRTHLRALTHNVEG